MAKADYRRRVGLALGVALGLAYGLVSQNVNRLLLPGVPLYQPPFGRWGNVLVIVTALAAIGLLAALPANGVLGAFLGAGLGSLLIVLLNLLLGDLAAQARLPALVVSAFVVAPLAALLVPLTGIVRWAANRQVDAAVMAEHGRPAPGWRRASLPLALCVAAGLAGAFGLYTPNARVVLTRMNDMLQAGLRASGEAALPGPLRSVEVADFRGHARGPYTLQPETNDLNRFRIPRPAASLGFEQAVIARFAGGWSLVCIFPAPDQEPACGGFSGRLP